MRTAFVDETKSKTLVLAACLVRDDMAKQIRSQLRALLLPGQRSVHFAKESDRRRKSILSAVSGMQISIHVFDTRLKPDASSRAVALRMLLEELTPRRVCVELDVTSLKSDQLVLADFKREHFPQDQEFQYSFETPSREPLLWLPDIFAWCYQRGWSMTSPKGAGQIDVSYH